MDSLQLNYLETFAEFQNALKSMKSWLAQLEILMESIKYTSAHHLEDSYTESILSSLGTKWMQLNVGLEKLRDIKISHPNDTQAHVNETANRFILYSVLDEFKLNDSQKPVAIVAEHDDTVRFGFISHIDDAAKGSVYILDEMSMPDPLVLYGNAPKPLSDFPKPGEMFAYWYQSMYLVRAVLLEYDYRSETRSTNQFSAKLIDIGCVVQIDNKPNCVELYEVTSAAKKLPSYTKLSYVFDILSNECVYDLLHSRVQYQILHSNHNKMIINILKEVVNPFVGKHQKEWNFYSYLLVRDVYLASPRKNDCHREFARIQPAAVKQVKKPDVNLNPFADPSLYQITDITYAPLTDKTNPFYYDPNDEVVRSKPKFQNFRLTKILNSLTDEWIDENLPHISTSDKAKKQMNQPLARKMLTYDTNKAVKTVENVVKASIPNENAQKVVDSTPKPTLDKPAQVNHGQNSLPVAKAKNEVNQPMAQKKLAYDTNNAAKTIENVVEASISNENAQKVVDSAPKPTLDKPAQINHGQNSLQVAKEKNEVNQPVACKSFGAKNEFPQPENPPKIGDSIVLLYEHMISVEEFYAVIRNERDSEVEDFSLYFNYELNNKELVQYGEDCTPKLFDKVIALFEDSYYRAKVVKIIDTHVFQVFYVDYGNCARVNTMEMFKWEWKEWDETPVYALHFRINGVQEINQGDHEARRVLEQLMIADTKATIVDIVYDKRMNRTTYVVDLFDENGLSIAEVLAIKNFAYYHKKQ